MLKPGSRLWGYGLSLALAMASLPGLAASFDFRGESTINVSFQEDRELGLMLAHILAFEHALAEAQAHLSQRGIFNSNALDTSYHAAISTSLARSSLEYEHKDSNPLKLTYKTKLSYDSLDYPDDLEAYYQDNLFKIEFSRRSLDYNTRVREQLQAYLNKLQSTQDQTFRDHLRSQAGAKLMKIVTVTEYMRDAYTLFGQKEYEKALKLVDKSIATGINYADLYWFKAALKSQDEEWDDAIAAINKALELQPNEPMFYFSRGQAYLAQGLLIQQAEADFDKVVELRPNWGWAHYYRAYIKSQRNRCSQALADYKKACGAGIESACKITSCKNL